jgi:hypothetical protein
MRKIGILLSLFSWLSACAQETDSLNSQSIPLDSPTKVFPYQLDTALIHQKMIEIKQYLSKNNTYNQQTAILINMRIPSGRKRLFVCDLTHDCIKHQALVAHGSGSETEHQDSLTFSNTPNSYMTSLGKYRIGKSYVGAFGKSYLLHGLDPSNSKAQERSIVLHRLDCVPDEEQEEPICLSLGCPMVSDLFFQTLDHIIQASSKPVILYIFY